MKCDVRKLTAKQKEGFRLRSIPEVAEFFDVSPSTVSTWIDNGMPRYLKPGPLQKKANAYLYDLQAIVQWYRTDGPGGRNESRNRRNEQQRQLPIDPEDPLIDSGEATPALERLRLAKAKLAEADWDERRKRLVPIDDLMRIMAGWAEPLRRLGERLHQRFGREAAEMLNRTLDEECRRVIEHEIRRDVLPSAAESANTLGDRSSDSTAAAAD